MTTSTPPPMKAVGFGHPLLDITSHVDMEFLQRFNTDLGAVMLAEKHQLPVFEELSQRRDVEYVPGGAAMNAIRVLRWMCQLDICSYVGCLGDDEFGCILERALQKGGVRSIFQRNDDAPTGTCACLIVDKERSLIANLGAALEVTMEHINSEVVMQAIEEAQLYYCEGFFLNTKSSPENSMLLAKHAAEHNKIFSYNLSAPYLCHIFKDRWLQVMPYIDYVFGSRIDAEAYGEAFGWQTLDLEDTIMRIVTLPKVNTQRPRVVVITAGADTTIVATKQDGIRKFETPSVPPEEIVDLNGAGDAFVGGFLSQLVQHRPLELCIRAGQLTAAEVIRNNGCTFGDEPPKL
jgi:adenosine kinase